MRISLFFSFLIFLLVSGLATGEEANSCSEIKTDPSTCSNQAKSLACKYECIVQETKFCSGCMPISELLRLELSWDLDVDLDLHVWRPAYPRGDRNRVGHDLPGDVGSKRKADYKCDRKGINSKNCMKDSERINVMADAFDFTDTEDRVYCAAVQRYSESPERVPYKLTIVPHARSVFECSGSEFITAPSELVLEQKNELIEKSLEHCESAFKDLQKGSLADRPWGMMVAFEVPVIGEELTRDKFAELFIAGTSPHICKEVLSR